MTFEFFRFELREQLRSPLLWLLAGLFALLAFGAASSDTVQIGGSIGNVHRNAPVVIATWMTAFTLIGMLIITIFVSGALLRDFELGTSELFFASPIRKRDYLAGRLGAALVASLVLYVVIAAGLFIAQFMPWIDRARLGPISLYPYAWTFAVMVLPNVLFTGALLALLAVVTRSILWVYIGVVAFFVLYGISGTLLQDLDNVRLATLLDPLGIRAMSRTVRYWSAAERNSNVPEIASFLLANRALWSAIGLAMLGATFALFRTERSGTTGRKWWRRSRNGPVTTAFAASRAQPVAVPRVTPAFDRGTTWRQFLRQLRFDTAGVFRSVPFLVLLVFGLTNFIPVALDVSTMYDTPVWPITSQMLQALQQSYSFLLIIIVLFYAGELVWKERGAKIDEVTDAMPVADWVPLLAKFCALVAVVLAFQLGGALVAMAIQLGKGYTHLEPLVYLQTLALDSVVYIVMGGLALALQVLSNNKFLGYALLILVLVLQTALGLMDYTHNLYNFGSWPNAPYSDMNGYGHFLAGQLAFQAYWALFLLGLLLLCTALWVRGVGGGRGQRIALAKQRLHGRLGVALGVVAVAFVAWGGVLFWNTNIRNEFRSPDEQLDLAARYEREYKQYETLPQPRIMASHSEVDLRPHAQSMTATIEYTVHNPHATPIADVHLQMANDEALVDVDLGGTAELVHHDAPLGYRIYRLADPIQPGERREFRFAVDYHPTGIENSQAQTQFVDNGSFFNNSSAFPSFGYNAQVEISDRNERRKRDMGEPRRMPLLEDEAARANTYLTDDADWIAFSTSICTAPEQVALAPGKLVREYARDGRRCFDYALDRPMLNFHAWLSGEWEVTRGAYKAGTADEIPIEIYHHPAHDWNVARMIEGVRESLDYFETAFTPYQHDQVRIVEFPRYAGFAQSFAGTIPYSESIGFIADLRDPADIDYVYYVTAHEVAHQWWAHQVIGANVQGATVLSESLSQYSALMVMEREYGPRAMRKFLKYELDRYLSSRGGETVEELPLVRVENQQYIHYRKGSLVFYRLREEMGEDALNRALKRFLQDKGYQQPPYATSAELVQYIREEAGPEHQQLITDLFEKISFFDNRVEEATATRRADGKFAVTLDLHAAKLYADGEGNETPGTMDDWVEVGVFGESPTGEEADQPVLYLERHHVSDEEPEITVVVDSEPYEAGFDPYNKLIDRVSADNRKRVDIEE